MSRPDPIFLADATALDFLNTGIAPNGVPVEWIEDGEDLVSWLLAAKLIDAQIADAMRRTSLPAELDAVAAQARSLRSWFGEFVHRHRGEDLEENALAELSPLNQVLERDDAFGSVVTRNAVASSEAHDGCDHHSPFQWQLRRRWREPGALIAPVAQAMAEFVCSADFTRVKQCEGPGCVITFLDKTRAGTRRWCSMAVCGNRAKQAAHRDRHPRGHGTNH